MPRRGVSSVLSVVRGIRRVLRVLDPWPTRRPTIRAGARRRDDHRLQKRPDEPDYLRERRRAAGVAHLPDEPGPLLLLRLVLAPFRELLVELLFRLALLDDLSLETREELEKRLISPE